MNGVHFVLGSPNAYIQEPGILHKTGEWIGQYGKSVFIITGEKSWASCGDRITKSLDEKNIEYHIYKYNGECSYEEVERLSALVTPETELICGVGGGKVLDTAKAVAIGSNKPFVAIPTLAATCAAVANLSIDHVHRGWCLH